MTLCNTYTRSCRFLKCGGESQTEAIHLSNLPHFLNDHSDLHRHWRTSRRYSRTSHTLCSPRSTTFRVHTPQRSHTRSPLQRLRCLPLKMRHPHRVIISIATIAAIATCNTSFTHICRQDKHIPNTSPSLPSLPSWPSRPPRQAIHPLSMLQTATITLHLADIPLRACT